MKRNIGFEECQNVSEMVHCENSASVSGVYRPGWTKRCSEWHQHRCQQSTDKSLCLSSWLERWSSWSPMPSAARCIGFAKTRAHPVLASGHPCTTWLPGWVVPRRHTRKWHRRPSRATWRLGGPGTGADLERKHRKPVTMSCPFSCCR